MFAIVILSILFLSFSSIADRNVNPLDYEIVDPNMLSGGNYRARVTFADLTPDASDFQSSFIFYAIPTLYPSLNSLNTRTKASDGFWKCSRYIEDHAPRCVQRVWYNSRDLISTQRPKISSFWQRVKNWFSHWITRTLRFRDREREASNENVEVGPFWVERASHTRLVILPNTIRQEQCRHNQQRTCFSLFVEIPREVFDQQRDDNHDVLRIVVVQRKDHQLVGYNNEYVRRLPRPISSETTQELLQNQLFALQKEESHVSLLFPLGHNSKLDLKQTEMRIIETNAEQKTAEFMLFDYVHAVRLLYRFRQLGSSQYKFEIKMYEGKLKNGLLQSFDYFREFTWDFMDPLSTNEIFTKPLFIRHHRGFELRFLSDSTGFEYLEKEIYFDTGAKVSDEMQALKFINDRSLDRWKHLVKILMWSSHKLTRLGVMALRKGWTEGVEVVLLENVLDENQVALLENLQSGAALQRQQKLVKRISENNSPEEINKLLDVNLAVDGQSLFLKSVKEGNLEATIYYIQAGSFLDNVDDHEGKNVYILATERKNTQMLDLFKKLVLLNYIDGKKIHFFESDSIASLINLPDNTGMNALLYGLRPDNHEIVNFLISQGATDPETKPENGFTAFLLASKFGYTELAQNYLESGAEINAAEKLTNRTALHYAVIHKNMALASAILQHEFRSIKDTWGFTPKDLAADKPEFKELFDNHFANSQSEAHAFSTVKSLIESRRDANSAAVIRTAYASISTSMAHQGGTLKELLVLAIQKNCVETFRELVLRFESFFTDVNLKSLFGETDNVDNNFIFREIILRRMILNDKVAAYDPPFFKFALRMELADVATELITKAPDEECRQQLQSAVSNDDAGLVTFIIESSNLCSGNEDDRKTLAFLSLSQRKLDVFRKLLEFNASLTTETDNNGKTALMYAAETGLEAIKIIFDRMKISMSFEMIAKEVLKKHNDNDAFDIAIEKGTAETIESMSIYGFNMETSEYERKLQNLMQMTSDDAVEKIKAFISVPRYLYAKYNVIKKLQSSFLPIQKVLREAEGFYLSLTKTKEAKKFDLETRIDSTRYCIRTYDTLAKVSKPLYFEKSCKKGFGYYLSKVEKERFIMNHEKQGNFRYYYSAVNYKTKKFINDACFGTAYEYLTPGIQWVKIPDNSNSITVILTGPTQDNWRCLTRNDKMELELKPCRPDRAPQTFTIRLRE